MDLLNNPILFGLYSAPIPKWREYGFRAPGKSQKPWGKSLKCISDEPGGGLTNGMPWDGTSPVSAATEIDAHKTRPIPVSRSAPGTPVWAWDLPRLWEMASNPWVKLTWRDVAIQLNRTASVMADEEFAAELRLLGDIALIRHLDL